MVEINGHGSNISKEFQTSYRIAMGVDAKIKGENLTRCESSVNDHNSQKKKKEYKVGQIILQDIKQKEQ